MFLGEPAADDRSDCVQNIFTRQIVGRRDFCLSCWLIMPLLLHDLVAVTSELYSGKGVNSIVDAAVTGTEAAEHLTVGGVDDRIASQRGNVALPKINIILNRLQIRYICDTLAAVFLLQISVLDLQKILARFFRHPDIEQ